MSAPKGVPTRKERRALLRAGKRKLRREHEQDLQKIVEMDAAGFSIGTIARSTRLSSSFVRGVLALGEVEGGG